MRAALVVSASLVVASAQQFAEVGQQNLPFDRNESEQIVFADVDGDGDLDGLTVTFGGLNRLLENDGAGTFTDATAARLPGAPSDFYLDAEFADLDADGDLDVFVTTGGSFVGGPGGQNRLLLNDGSGVFTDDSATAMPIDNDFSEGVALGDVDLDGDLDLVIVNDDFTGPVQNKLYVKTPRCVHRRDRGASASRRRRDHRGRVHRC